MWQSLFRAELAFYIILVIKILLGQIERVRLRFLRPTRFFIRAAFRASFGIRRNFSAAIGTNLRSHFKASSTKLQTPEKPQASTFRCDTGLCIRVESLALPWNLKVEI